MLAGLELFLFLRNMALPFFYVENLESNSIVLDEETSKHVIQVLRMNKGDSILLTNGKGKKADGEIVDDNRKRCAVKITSLTEEKVKGHRVSIAISLIKNSSRFEWFLEKATEIGVREIIPLVCQRTEKEKFRKERMQTIIVSAMLQSQQCWMPVLHEPVEFPKAIQLGPFQKKFIAHCLPQQKQALPHYSPIITDYSSLILIGPEGDFTPDEIQSAIKNNFLPVTLGATRLRTETAGIVAAALLYIQ